MNSDWLQNLKVGDKVIVQHRGLGEGKSLLVVSNITKNFIVVNGRKFRKGSGYGTGDGYHHPYLIETTSEAMAAFEEERYRAVFQNKLSHLSWDDVPLDRIKQIRELVEPYSKRKENNAH